jgi:phosphate/sulfate permease
MALPVLSILFGLLGKDNAPHWYYSISATFYTNSGPIMVGTLFSAAVFLICYGVINPYQYWLDGLTAIVSGIAFILIACFPCGDTTIPYVGLLYLPVNVSAVIHNVSAVAGFASLAVMVAFCFTKTRETTKQKQRRNRVFRICAVIMAAVMSVFAVGAFTGLNGKGPFILVYETLLLWSTGIAWFTKAGLIFKDT